MYGVSVSEGSGKVKLTGRSRNAYLTAPFNIQALIKRSLHIPVF
jgi:hypothetical protein